MKQSAPELQASQVLESLGVASPEDIDVDAIAMSLGAVVVYEPLSGCDGRIIGSGSEAIITVNSNVNPGRQRFTAAHETGHWLFDRGSVHGACAEEGILKGWSVAKGGIEYRANRFAAELLMPREMVRRVVPCSPLTLDMVRDVLDSFRTTLTAAAIRCVEVGPLPSVVLCCEGGQVRWTAKSDALPRGVWTAKSMPRRAHGAGLREVGDQNGGYLSADEWIEHDDAHRYQLHEETVRLTSDLTLTILTWPDEDQLVVMLDDE